MGHITALYSKVERMNDKYVGFLFKVDTLSGFGEENLQWMMPY